MPRRSGESAKSAASRGWRRRTACDSSRTGGIRRWDWRQIYSWRRPAAKPIWWNTGWARRSSTIWWRRPGSWTARVCWPSHPAPDWEWSSTWTRWKSIRANASARRERVADMAASGGTTRDLPRLLGVLDATAIVVGIVIGSGIFVLPNVIARSVPSYAGIVAAWVIGGALSFVGALAYAELGAMLPATGGQYVFLREAYGPLCAFVCGWTFMLAVISGGSAWLAVTFSIYAGYFVRLTPVGAKAIAVALIVALSAVNYVGVREGAWVQRTFTCLKVAALVILVGAAFFSGHTATGGESAPARAGFAHFGVA